MDSGVRGENSSSPNGNQRIVSISIQRAAGDVCKVTCSGGFFFVPLSLLEELNLEEGITLTEQQLESLEFHHLVLQAYRKSLDLLSRREHSREMMRRKLTARRFPSNVAEAVVRRLETEGLIDDTQFGEYYLDYLIRQNKYGKGLICAKLREKGLSREQVEELVSTVSDSEEDEALRNAAEKLLRRKNITKERFVRGLNSRGFPLGKIYAYLQEYCRF